MADDIAMSRLTIQVATLDPIAICGPTSADNTHILLCFTSGEAHITVMSTSGERFERNITSCGIAFITEGCRYWIENSGDDVLDYLAVSCAHAHDDDSLENRQVLMSYSNPEIFKQACSDALRQVMRAEALGGLEQMTTAHSRAPAFAETIRQAS
ncbi:hypothetical protein [Marinivivus vitaminiproducens]|uniref:hypothetical protein n=1 Tax=Marinivivus vitaminiproducens TaxID=3035935 RepID=UPI0027A94E22|nr:hypothetical protein P4R82_24735 [Geminicoccaceae bacterium SCSIO 64248]